MFTRLISLSLSLSLSLYQDQQAMLYVLRTLLYLALHLDMLLFFLLILTKHMAVKENRWEIFIFCIYIIFLGSESRVHKVSEVPCKDSVSTEKISVRSYKCLCPLSVNDINTRALFQ